MRKVLYILGHLDDLDVEWMGRAGLKRQVAKGRTLIHQGDPVNSLYIVIDGELEVQAEGAGHLARLGPGEVVGELSFVDSNPPSATVTAQTDAVVLDLARTDLMARLAEDQGFSSRFYKALAMFLADRLRDTVRRLGYGGRGDLDSDDVLADELGDEILDGVSLAGDRFDRMIKTLASARAA